jgi:hypothetical protein
MVRGLVMLLLVLVSPALPAADDYLQQLVAQARARGLAQHPQWRALLHYEPRLLLPGVESLADDPAFFNAPEGKTDPEQELAATLAAFFEPPEESEARQHPQCRFIARYHWLAQELAFDPARLPPQPCRRFYEWHAALDPAGLTLIFPAAYLNNPASAYGHTFLRVDARGQDERTRLLAYAINYAADTDETNGLLFAIRGIFGGYPGTFSIAPYYVKVGEYNDLENRDIWEYELDFAPPEIERLLMHAWELGTIRFDYFFFDENCSYQLLALFEAARPSLEWTARFPAWAIPSDTVRVVVEEPGLLRRTTWRPARSTLLRHRARQLAPALVQRARTLALAPGPLPADALDGLGERERARVLELAYEYLDYLRLRGEAPHGEDTAERLRALLLARSRLAVAPAPPPRAPAVRPEQGHRSARIVLGLGREGGATFQELRLRPAYHDLLDPEPGYVRGAEIEFFAVAVRRHERDQRLRLERLDLVRITSLSARDALLEPLSWRIRAGWERGHLRSGEHSLAFRLEGGSGLAWQDAGGRLWYTMLDVALAADDDLASGYALGAGPAAGVVLDLSPRWRAQLELRGVRYEAGEEHSASEVALNQRFALGAQSALRLEWKRSRVFDRVEREIQLSWSHYF